MTTLVINGETQKWQPTQANTVLDVLMEAQENLWDAAREIIQIKVNGAQITELTEENLGTLPGENALIEVEISAPTQNPTLRETVIESKTYIGRLKEGFNQLSNAMRVEPNPKSFQDLGHGMVGLATIFELFETILGDSSIEPQTKENCREFIGGLAERIKELNEAQENEDHILIADILEYECIDALEEMEELLGKIADQLT